MKPKPLSIRRVAALIIISVGIVLPVSGQSTAPSGTAAGVLSRDEIDGICSNIRSEEPLKIAAAVKDIENAIKVSPHQAAHELVASWAKWLWGASTYHELSELSRKAIIAAPDATDDLEELQRIRTACIFYMGGKGSASSAKALYNVSSIRKTESRFELIVRCLKFCRPEEPDIGDRFLLEQRENTPAERSVLGGIRVNQTLYKKQAAALSGADFKSAMGKGNLLLIMDFADDARHCFETAVASAGSDAERLQAKEGIARAMKAHDGNMLRARQWLAQQTSDGSGDARGTPGADAPSR